MARVTVEDCLKNVENRFDLVLKAAKRAHNIELGAQVLGISEDNDKPTVLALREIAEGLHLLEAEEARKTEQAENERDKVSDVEQQHLDAQAALASELAEHALQTSQFSSDVQNHSEGSSSEEKNIPDVKQDEEETDTGEK